MVKKKVKEQSLVKPMVLPMEQPLEPSLDIKPGKVVLVPNLLPSSMNKFAPKRPQVPIVQPKKPFIRKLLSDEEALAKIRELAENGASITSIEALMEYHPGKLRNALEKGRTQLDKKGPYKKFYLMFRSWVAKARSTAETIMARRTPEKWMDRNSSNRLLESEEDRSLAIQSANLTDQSKGPNVPVKDIVRALEILREQGVSIDDSLDKGQLHISATEPDDEKE